MAVPGTKPTQNPRHRNKPETEWREVVDTPFRGRSPALPKGTDWAPFTKKWWTTVRRMPHCVLWTPSDWMVALACAYVVNEHWMDPTSEMRIREKQLGLTDESRRDLRIRYVPPKPEVLVEAVVTELDDYRDITG